MQKRSWTEADRPKLIKQGFAYLSGFQHIGIYASKEEREELADIAIKNQISMHDAVTIFMKQRTSRDRKYPSLPKKLQPKRYRSTKVGQYYLHLYKPLEKGGHSPYYTTVFAGDKGRAISLAREWRNKGYKVEIVKRSSAWGKKYSKGRHERFLSKHKRKFL